MTSKCNAKNTKSDTADIMASKAYLSSIGVAIKFASITVGAWQFDLSNAIAIPHRNTVTPINKTSQDWRLTK